MDHIINCSFQSEVI